MTFYAFLHFSAMFCVLGKILITEKIYAAICNYLAKIIFCSGRGICPR